MSILSNVAPISIIGASMIDIIGRSFEPIIVRDSNPGLIHMAAGGVSRNVSENLARLGVPVNFITALGNDRLSEIIVDSCLQVDIDISHSFRSETKLANTYLAILDEQGDLELALSDTTTLDELPIEHLEAKHEIIEQGQLIVIDASLTAEIVDYLLKRYPHKPIYLDPVSIGKSKHVKPSIGSFYMLKCNILEAQFLSDMKIDSEDDFYLVANYFHQLGIKEVVITRGPKGIFYSLDNQQGFYQHRPVEVINATGAGDAFLAGWIYSQLHNLSLMDKVKFASEVAAYALESRTTVSSVIDTNKIMEAVKDGFK